MGERVKVGCRESENLGCHSPSGFDCPCNDIHVYWSLFHHDLRSLTLIDLDCGCSIYPVLL